MSHLERLWPYGDLEATLVAALGIAGLVGLAAMLRRRGVRGDVTRAFVHVGTGVAVAVAPYVFASPLGPCALAVLWGGLNAWALRTGRLRGLHDAGREGYGTVAFPLALVLGVGLMNGLDGFGVRPPLAWGMPVGASVWLATWLVLAFADPAASFVGRRYGRGAAKSTMGTATFAVVAFGVGFCALVVTPVWDAGLALHGALVLMVVTTFCERLGRHGWDNLAIVVGGLAGLVAAVWGVSLGEADGPAIIADTDMYMALAVAAVFGLLAWRTRLLTSDGALPGALLAATVIAFGGPYHVATGVGFFVFSSLLSKLPGGRAAEDLTEKGSTRDAGQVLANGGVAWACLLLAPDQPVLWAGAFAAAAADTWATEIGTRWGGTPRLVTTLRRVPPGTSGAVSMAGTLGAVLGAASVAGLGILGAAVLLLYGAYFEEGAVPHLLVTVTAGGVAGALFDTLLGATLQVRYRTQEGVLTERPVARDGTPHAYAGGLRWMNNDVVNALATGVGALVAGLLDAALR